MGKGGGWREEEKDGIGRKVGEGKGTCQLLDQPVLNSSLTYVHTYTYYLLTYLSQVLVGATGHEPRANLQSAFPAFAAYGVNVTSLDRCGKFAFVALKGSPERSASVLTKSAEGNAWLVVKVLGTNNVSARRPVASLYTAR